MAKQRTSREVELDILELWDRVWFARDIEEMRRLAKHAFTLEDHLVTVKWAERHEWRS